MCFRKMATKKHRKHKAFSVFFVLFCGYSFLFAQDTANPMAALKDEVKRVLDAAGKPFTEEQEQAVSLMMEDRRQASEQLFGDLMDFRQGPTRGEENDRLRDAIEWMRSEFLTRLR